MSGSRPEGGPEVPGLTDALRKIPSSGIHISYPSYLSSFLAEINYTDEVILVVHFCYVKEKVLFVIPPDFSR